MHGLFVMARGEGIRALQAGLLPACAYQVLKYCTVVTIVTSVLDPDDLAGSWFIYRNFYDTDPGFDLSKFLYLPR